jgi:branched-chain amino acid transport system substrate-binding protein
VKVNKRFWVRTMLGAPPGWPCRCRVRRPAWAQQGQPVKIGLLATLEGPFAAGGADGMRGAELAVKQRGGVVAGRKIEIIKASSNANPDVAVNAARKLVEQDKVDILVGPLSGGEGIASRTTPRRSRRPPSSTAARARRPPRWSTPAPTSSASTPKARSGWWAWARRMDKGYKRVMVIAEDYAFPYSQVQGFMAEYCRLGGKVPLKAWVPLGGKDYSSVIARIPKDVDALLVVLGGADAVNFLNQYETPAATSR